jgi:hypothetical protein
VLRIQVNLISCSSTRRNADKEVLPRHIYLFALIYGDADDTQLLRDQYGTQRISTGNDVAQRLLLLYAIHSNLAHETCLSTGPFWYAILVLGQEAPATPVGFQ